MKKYTRNELWQFVWRADTHEKIAIAADWLKTHVEDNDLWDDLMVQLSQQSRELYANEAGRASHI